MIQPSNPQTRSSLHDRLTAIDVLLVRAAQRCDKARPQLKEARDLLAGVREDLPDRHEDHGDGTTPPGRGPRPAKTVEHYRVEAIGRTWALAEYRSSRPQPFRCPKAVLIEVARALARADHPLKFEDVRRATRRNLGGSTATYLFRIALRFMIARGLVEHGQTRFRATASELESAVADAWEAAKKAPVPGTPIRRP